VSLVLEHYDSRDIKKSFLRSSQGASPTHDRGAASRISAKKR